MYKEKEKTIITSLKNSHIKELTKLNMKKYAKESDVFLVEGKHLVDEAYRNNILVEVLSVDDVDYKDVKITYVSFDIIKKITDTLNPQGIVGIVKKYSNKDYLQTIKKAKTVVLLDGVSDPGNLGTIIRTAAGFDVDLVLLSEDCVDLYNSKVVRATQGAIFNTNILCYDIKKAINDLKNSDFLVLGTSLYNSLSLKDLDIKDNEKIAFVLGNEANGVKTEVLDLCDKNVRIDISNKIESLNVSVAGAIMMYYLSIKNK